MDISELVLLDSPALRKTGHYNRKKEHGQDNTEENCIHKIIYIVFYHRYHPGHPVFHLQRDTVQQGMAKETAGVAFG